MSRVYHGEDLTDLGLDFIDRGGKGDAQALFDLSILLQLRGQPDTGVAVQQQALAIQQHFCLEPTIKRHTVRLLALVAPGNLMTNTPLEFIAEGAGFSMQFLYVDPTLPFPQELPDHDIAIVALSELDRNLATLDYINNWISQWPRPVLNMPAPVSVLGRDLICHQLQNLPHIEMPVTIRVSRETLFQVAGGNPPLEELIVDGNMPVIIRPVDSHAGYGLERLDQPEALQDYLARYNDAEFFVSRYVDYRSKDGQFRKYRVVMIDGQPELAHMAVSDHWMVHYGNAGMEQSAAKRFEEAGAMGNFRQGFAKRHAAAIKTLHETVGLDYFGMDCSETQDGKLLIFEVGASLNIHAMDCSEMYPYKRPQMQRIFNNFLAMLQKKAQLSG
ncbi:ATP-grasp domain-containing protein [Aliamphritea spongicola]|uniref:ATP-grasp domain-containing protein n=1 Tax=Aliamphritea spongicola TaxID=707589 RepID=UPI00196AB9A9|nr:hypothetical protein [Aliamphritea spongicola]MBN3564591.1 hypothetical protein [Aliamphritea spongicola]